MSTMQPFPPLPSAVPEEHSGWWPSDRSAKSRFRALFSRSKSQDKVPRQYVAETFPPHPSVQPLEVQPGPLTATNRAAKRARSTTWSKGNRSSSQRSLQQQRPRNMTSWDPPPLFHAYSQAKVHAVLDIPPTLTDAIFRGGSVRRNSISSETPSRSSFENSVSSSSTEDVPLSHKRHVSSLSTGSLSQKLFILTGTGFVLQYSADGLNDRMPEKILELGSESVAFASDSIRGKHWVLRISHDGNLDQVSSESSTVAWSKWSFRSSENRKLTKDLLLVFDNAQSLGTWLTAVRREIEQLGGLEYRPDSREEEPKGESRSSLKAKRSLPVLGQSSPLMQMEESSNDEPPSPLLLPPAPLWHPARHFSRSTTDSSIHTVTDLDRLRNPSFSDDRSISSTPTSFRGSANSISNAIDSFSRSLESSEPGPIYPESRLSTPTQDDIGELSMYMATPKKPSTRIHIPKRTTSLDPHPDVIDHDLFAQTNDSVESGPSLQSRPISTIAPLPAPGHIRKISARHRHELQGSLAQPMTPVSSRPSSIRSRSSSYTQEYSPDGSQKRVASYSLFPKTPSTDQPHIHVPSGLPSPPATTPATVYDSMCRAVSVNPSSPDSTDEERDAGARSRPSSKSSRPSSRRNGKVLSVDSKNAEAVKGQVMQPQRSPAVTEAHLQTCFGARPDAPRRKLSAQGSISGITTTTLESGTVDGPVVRLANPPRKQRHIKGQKSMPSLVHRTLPPLGPPPSGPLPPLPTEACLPVNMNKFTSSFSCVPLPKSQAKHVKAESSAAALPSKKPAPVLADAPPLPPKDFTTSKPPAHSRNMSSVSSVGSVRHVTAWLASPRVAAFSAKYDTESSRTLTDQAPRLHVPLSNSPVFSSGFETLMS